MLYRLCVAALVAAFAAPAVGQPQWPDPPARAKAKKAPPDDVEELTPGQIKRAQERASPARPKEPPQAVKRAPKGGAGVRQIACSGPFAKDSSHIRLAQVFGSQNVAYTEIDGPKGSKLMASVLFPKDARRRLEVLWDNDATRTGTQVIAINGQSAWSAPHGLRLAQPIAAIEKINRKPFKLSSFGAEGASVAGWEGGALASLPGGCKLGLRFMLDQRAPEEARLKLEAATDLQSNDAGLRAARASVVEILLGY